MRAMRRALAATLTFGLLLSLNVAAHADTANGVTESGLDFVGFVHLADLTLPNGSHPATGSFLQVVGNRPDGALVVYDGSTRGLFTIDPSSLTKTASIATGFPASTQGTASAEAMSPSGDRIFIGSAVSRALSTPSCGAPATVVCTDGPLASAPQVASVDLSDGTKHVFQMPADYDGTDVVALTPATSPDGSYVLYALLYEDTSGGGQLGDPGSLARTLDLVALDPAKIASADQTGAVLWSYSISSCASLPNQTTNNQQEFLGVDPAGRWAYFACRGNTSKSTAPPTTPAGAVVVDFGAAHPASASAPASFRTTYYPQGAGAAFSVSGGDPVRGLLFLTSVASVNKEYIFNVEHRAWVGSVPFPQGGDGNLWGTAVDPSNGRDYVVYVRDFAVGVQDDDLPVDQGKLLALGDIMPSNARPPFVDPVTHELAIAGRFAHRDKTAYPSDDVIAVYHDTRPVDAPPAADDPDALTHDIPITADTPVTFGAFASAFGARATFVGGLHSTPLGNLSTINPALVLSQMCAQSPDPRFCFGAPTPSDGSRTFNFGQVDGVEVSNSSVNATATSFSYDEGTSKDGTALTSYNALDDPWNRFAPAGSPGNPTGAVTSGAGSGRDQLTQKLAPATCSNLSSAKPASSGGADAACDVAGQQAAADAATPTAIGGDAKPSSTSATSAPGSTSPVQIGYAGSATRVGHTATNQSVTQAVAVARGIKIAVPGGPTITIGEVTTAASSTAAGLHDTAASTFTRAIKDVTVTVPSPAGGADTVVFSCGFDKTIVGGTDQTASGKPCDPRQLTDAVSARSPSPVVFLTPSPDSSPSITGSPGGAQAEVIKDLYQRLNDYFTNGDPSFEVPGLQVILVGDQSQPSRMVLNLAGVRVESHNQIGLPPPPPIVLPNPSLTLTLVDGSVPPVPLAGGTFDLLTPDGATATSCTTAADGIGTCKFTDLAPGDYTVHESTPPPGFAAAPDYPISLETGQDYSATFVNLPAIGVVRVNLTSAADKKPLSGGVFAMFGGGSVLGVPVATCTTDKTGTCGFDKVPLGDYTMHQVSAPRGFLLGDDVPFTLSTPGQDATLAFVDGVPGKKAVPPKFIPGKPAVPPHTEVLHIGGNGVPVTQDATLDAGPLPVVSSVGSGAIPPLVAGGPLGALTRLPAQLARLLTHSPQQAVLLLFMWIVLGLPVYLWVRRRQFLIATEGS